MRHRSLIAALSLALAAPAQAQSVDPQIEQLTRVYGTAFFKPKERSCSDVRRNVFAYRFFSGTPSAGFSESMGTGAPVCV